MKIKLRITYTDKLNAIKEYEYTGSMPQIRVKTNFIEVEIPENTEFFELESIDQEIAL